MSTPLLTTYVRQQTERRERQMQTAFPAKVLDWNSSANTVRLEPQFIETWVTSDGTTRYEDAENTYIDNVPVLFPRSGSWSITFPIETGSFGLVICTKYSLDAFRNQGQPSDPGDLRRFTMSGAVFHPVNMEPNSSALSGASSSVMELGRILTSSGASTVTTQFVALANLLAAEFIKVSSALDSVAGLSGAGGSDFTGANTYQPASAVAVEAAIRSTSVKVSE